MAAPRVSVMIANKILAGLGYQRRKFAQKIQGSLAIVADTAAFACDWAFASSVEDLNILSQWHLLHDEVQIGAVIIDFSYKYMWADFNSTNIDSART